MATWDRLVVQLHEIPKTLDQELAVVKTELIARLAEKYFPNEDGNLDQHIIGQALAQLVRSGEVITTSAVTRGGRGYPYVLPLGTPRPRGAS